MTTILLLKVTHYRFSLESLKGRGNMAELVDVTDLKSVDLNNREGSSPSIPKCMMYFY